MQNFFGIIIVLFIVSAIISAIKKNPEVKKFFQDIKNEINGTTGNANTTNTTNNNRSVPSRPNSNTNNRTVANKTPKADPKEETRLFGDRIGDRAEMKSQLTEMQTIDFTTMKSRNQQMGQDGHYHPAGEDGKTEEYDAYSGSLGVTYAGEGCEEHYNLRYISDNIDDESGIKLTTLQKIIVFGEVLNKRKSR